METNWQENRRIAWPVVVFVCLLLVVDLLPRRSKLHQNLVNRLDYIYDITGLWQPRWILFTPVGTNVRMYVATIERENQPVVTWYSPNPAKLSSVEKWVQFRYIAYFDRLCGAEWFNANLFRWLNYEYGRTGNRITKITLTTYDYTVTKDVKPILDIVKPAATMYEVDFQVYDPKVRDLSGEASQKQEGK